jgi:putative hemolysin
MDKEADNIQQANDIKITERYISLERIIASKNKRLLHLIPKRTMKWFKKLICLDRINEIIYKYRDYKGVSIATKVLEELDIKLEVVNEENVPYQGRPLIVANHPIGSIDGMALISILGEKRSDVLFPVNDILCQLPGLKSVFVPINKYGKNNSNHNTLNNAFASNSCMMFFPAGTESKVIKGKVQDFVWKKTFIRKAQEFKRDIIPVYIEGMNSKNFYRWYKVRKFFGIKFDLEMIFLPREMFRQQGKTIKLVFGKKIDIEKLDNNYTALQWAKKIRDFVYLLKDSPKTEFTYK